MASAMKESKKEKKKLEKKDRKKRKSKDRSDIDESREVHEADEDHPGIMMVEVGEGRQRRTKRTKMSTASTPVADEDDAATSKTNQDKGRGAKRSKEESSAGNRNSEDDISPKKGKGNDRDAIRKSKREQRKMLAAQLPARDENGISYTKLQLRRMRKRLERGLDPIETPKEAADRARREAEMRREEQAEWAGLLYQGKEDRNTARSDDDDEEEGDDDDVVQQGDDHTSIAKMEASEVTPHASQGGAKKHRTKPIPPDYVCQACQNRHQPPHWIYDCVEKVTVRGTNQISQKHGKGAQNPKNKVFVSGLPFDATVTAVTKWFADRCGAVASVKLLTFEDSKRCRGQGFVAFDSPDAVRAALSLTGTAMAIDSKAKKGSEGSSKDGKELKLKVTKALNRAVTKSKQPGEKSTS